MKVLGISAATLASASVYLLRRRISKKWIDYRSEHHDLTNNVILITGGNTGLGYAAARDFAKRNATVLIACRNMEKGKKAAESIHRATGNQNVQCMELDLASLASVKEFATMIKSHPDYSSINTLVCNAGVWVPEPEDGNKDPSKYKTKDGFEIHFGINHLSHLYLAKQLTDALNKSGDGRIIFVSSSLMKSGKVDFDCYDHIYEGRDKGQEEKKSVAPAGYSDTKLMNALTCRWLSTLLPPTVTTYSVCPGFCRSSLGRHVSFPFHKKLLVYPLMLMIQRTSMQGAQNIIFLALEDKSKLKSGEMYKDGEIAKEETDYLDVLGESAAKKLWEVSEGLLGDESETETETDD